MLIGPYIDGLAVVTGGVAGAFLGENLPERIRTALPLTLGLASIGLGIMLVTKVHAMPPVVMALALGAALGEVLDIERILARAAGKIQALVGRLLPVRQGLERSVFDDKFVAVMVLFCASGTGITGSMQEGMTGDPSILYIKTILDLFTAASFATVLGYAVAAIAVPQCLIQCGLATLALVILPMTTPTMMADFGATGGMIMLATGFRICEMKRFPVANMLPAMVLIFPLSSLWTHYIH